MENSDITSKKQSTIKTLAIAGLLGVTIFIAWLAVQIVNVFPSALTSLVGVANSVYNYNPREEKQIELVSNTTLVNANEAFSISWNKPLLSGTYTFKYLCDEGVVVSLSADNSAFSDLSCNTEYDLGETDSVNLFVDTKVERFTDLTYTIAFYRPNSQTPTASKESSITVVNAEIGSNEELVLDTPEEEPEIETTEEVVDPLPTEEVVAVEPEVEVTPISPEPETKPTSTTAVKPTTTATPEYIYTYAIPTSNPNGTPDLSVGVVGLGFLATNNTFVRTNNIVRNSPGAIQFSVHNIGDKTSLPWSYTVKLPGGTTYSSEKENPLLPNERAVITVSYPAVTNSYLESFAMTVTTTGQERTTTNNTAGATEIVRQ